MAFKNKGFISLSKSLVSFSLFPWYRLMLLYLNRCKSITSISRLPVTGEFALFQSCLSQSLVMVEIKERQPEWIHYTPFPSHQHIHTFPNYTPTAPTIIARGIMNIYLSSCRRPSSVPVYLSSGTMISPKLIGTRHWTLTNSCLHGRSVHIQMWYRRSDDVLWI